MTKTPIQKMIEKLEAVNKVLVGLTGEYTTLKAVRAFMAELLKTAHTYASEEQSQKPAAPADLWDELSKFVEVGLRAASTQTHKPVIGFRQALNQVREILSKYRPVKALTVEPGEVVLWSGIYESTIRAAHKDECHHKLLGKRGVLVFRPEESK